MTMTALNARSIIFLAALLPLAQAVAQESEPADIEPAVDTSIDSFEPSVNTSVDSFEPAVDTASMNPGPEPAAETSADDFEPAVETTPQMANVQSSGPVMDRLTLGRTEITGNQELPKVMYIVPWQKSDPGDLMGRPVNTLLDEVLAPLDREEFIRQVDYYGDLHGTNEE